MFSVGLTVEETTLKDQLSYSCPTQKALVARMQKMSSGFSDLLSQEFLLELPSKPLLMQYVETMERKPSRSFTHQTSIEEMADELTKQLKLEPLQRRWHIQETCAVSGEGLSLGFDWLSSNVSEQRSSRGSAAAADDI